MTERVEAGLRIIAALSGLAQENMTQRAGWRFLELGRRIERALVTCRLVRCFRLRPRPSKAASTCCWSLPTARSPTGSAISWSRRWRRSSTSIMLDPNNPRSVVFQLDRIEAHLAALPKRSGAGRLSPVQQIAASIATRLRTAEAAAIDDVLLTRRRADADEIVGCDQRGLSRPTTSAPISSGRRWRDLRRPADDDVQLRLAGGACPSRVCG